MSISALELETDEQFCRRFIKEADSVSDIRNFYRSTENARSMGERALELVRKESVGSVLLDPKNPSTGTLRDAVEQRQSALLQESRIRPGAIQRNFGVRP